MNFIVNDFKKVMRTDKPNFFTVGSGFKCVPFTYFSFHSPQFTCTTVKHPANYGVEFL